MIQRELSAVLQKEGYNLYGNAFVTITNTVVTPDLSIARVYLSIYNVKEKNEVLDVINANLKELRRLLGMRIRKHVRKIPELEFYIDDTLDEVYKMEELFKKLKDPSDKKDT